MLEHSLPGAADTLGDDMVKNKKLYVKNRMPQHDVHSSTRLATFLSAPTATSLQSISTLAPKVVGVFQVGGVHSGADE